MAIELDELAGPDGGAEGRRLAGHWQDQINASKDSSEHKHWIKRGEAIEKRYRDDRSRIDEEGHRRYNSLWSNVEILKPALYGRTPLPIAERRFKDKDPVGRGAAQILERALRNEIEICGYDEALQRAVGDYLLPGRGTVWVRYEPVIGESVSLADDPQTDMRDSEGEIQGLDDEPEDDEKTDFEVTPKGRVRSKLNEGNEEDEGGERSSGMEGEPEEESDDDQEKLDETGDRIIRESTPVDFIGWRDFMTFPARARTWREVTAVCKLVYMSRDQMIKRFGKTVGKQIPLEKDNRGHRDLNTTMQAQEQDKGQVYEIWNKEDKTVYWVAIGYDYLLDRKEDPLGLENFFPTPAPLYANPTNNTLVPVPDFIQYQDQAIQIDELTQRIAMLTKTCKMTGLYNAAQKDIQRVFNESVENELIPVDDWSAFAESGGIESNWSLMPVKDIITIINELMVCKQKQIEEMDRLTGINDIMRGTSDARETLGGVRLKQNSTGTRLTSRQNEVARFARDTVRIMADIMSQHFSPQSLIEASGALYEEGLGPDDMPDLTTLQNPSPPPGPSPPQLGALPPPPGTGAPPMPPQGAPMGQPRPPMPGMPMGAPPSPMMQRPMGGPPSPPPPQGGMPGQNVVPFRPPGVPQGGSPMGGPNGMPPQSPGPPPVDPMMAKMKALQRIAASISLLRDQKTRGFRVDIEVDSTIFPDAAQEKQERTEFLTAVTTFLQNSMALGANAPEIIPLMAKMLQFGVRGFRVGRDLESAIDEFTDQAVVMSKELIQKRDTQPNPEMLKAQNEQTKGQVQLISAKTKAQSEQASASAEIQRQQIENQGEQQNASLDLQSNQIDLQMKLIDKRIEEMRMQMEMIKMHREAMTPPPGLTPMGGV